MSGHLTTTREEFEANYVPVLQKALAAGCHFVVGDASGTDEHAQIWLQNHNAGAVVYHMFTAPRRNVGFPTKGGFGDDLRRDAAMTRDSDFDIAWVREGRESSGTAENLIRRNNENQTSSNE